MAAFERLVSARRLDTYRQSADWPGQQPAWRWELAQHDHFLSLAATMLDVEVCEQDGVPLEPTLRAALDDQLGQAGLDAWARRVMRQGG